MKGAAQILDEALEGSIEGRASGDYHDIRSDRRSIRRHGSDGAAQASPDPVAFGRMPYALGDGEAEEEPLGGRTVAGLVGSAQAPLGAHAFRMEASALGGCQEIRAPP